MPQPLDHRTYRSVAELIKALRWRHLLTQQQLAERTGVAQAQLSRYEKGTAEPSLATLRRLLEPLGWAPTLGLEPSTAALDECFRAGHTAAELLGPDVVSVAVLAAQAAADGAAIVVGGDAAAVLQGVPLKTKHMELLVRPRDLPTLQRAAEQAHRGLSESDNDDRVWELWTFGLMTPVLLTDPLPANRLIRMEEEWLAEHEVPVVDLDALIAAGSLGPSAMALARRLREV